MKKIVLASILCSIPLSSCIHPLDPIVCNASIPADSFSISLFDANTGQPISCTTDATLTLNDGVTDVHSQTGCPYFGEAAGDIQSQVDGGTYTLTITHDLYDTHIANDLVLPGRDSCGFINTGEQFVSDIFLQLK